METMPKQRIFETSSITPWSRKLYRNADEFWRNSEGLHYAYNVYRALRGDYKRLLQPDAVFYVGKSPAAYLKTVSTNTILEDDVRDWQRFLWNQAIVPMLVIKSRTQIRVYTAYTQPKERQSEERIASIFETTTSVLELDQLWTAIEAGTVYEQNPEAFSRNQAVDRYLLDNLNVAAHQLAETQEGGINKGENLIFAHYFLTRLLFVCFLIEKGMIGKHFDDIENEILKKLHPATDEKNGYFLSHLFNDLGTYSKRCDALCRIFAYVKKRFNGSLFPKSITEEKSRYNEKFIQTTTNFLCAQELKTGQKLLGFWAYDFSVIPIETIGAVYESFLGKQGKLKEAQGESDSKRTIGAYYTPLHLAEMAVDIALENIEEIIKKPIHKLKALDPACGSGVFLVSLFGRIAESLRREENYNEKRRNIRWVRKLLPKLHQLYGIDISPTACHITCFSLYLALLEQLEPSDVEYLHEHNEQLPPLLANDPKGYKTIHYDNLFNQKLSLKKKDFDIVIGNPPWVSRHNQKDQKFLNLLKENPNVLGPDKQIAHGFMWKAPKYLSDDGTACLLLPTSVLLNDHTNKFQEQWLKSVTVERVVNFSDLRFVLFSGSVHPCIAIKFRPLPSGPENVIIYESPKTDIRSQKGGPMYIREEDTTNLHLKIILNAATKGTAPTIWKSHYWGSWRDHRLLSRLTNLPKLSDLTGKPNEGKRWIRGQGGQPYTENDAQKEMKIYTQWWDNTYKFLPIENLMNLVIIKEDFVEIPSEFQKLRRSPDKKIFSHPKVVVNHDSSKVAFCASPVIFRHTIQAIAGPLEDIDLLRFLSVVIKSDVIQYYLFHTSSNWGTERNSVLFYELLSIPFVLPEDMADSKRAQEIVDKAAKIIREFENYLEAENWFGKEEKRKENAKKIRRKLEPLVREYYDIDKYEAMLIEDTLRLATKSFHPKQSTMNIPTLRSVKPEESKVYTRTLCEMLNNFGQESGFKVNGEVIPGNPYSIVRVVLAEKIHKNVLVSTANKELARIFKRMKSLLQRKQGLFVFCQNLKVFDGDDLYILKPMQMRFWSRTAALNDADEIAGAILDSRGEKSKWQ